MTDYVSLKQVSRAAYYNRYCMVTICSNDNKTPSIPEAIMPVISGETGAVISRSSKHFGPNDFARIELLQVSQSSPQVQSCLLCSGNPLESESFRLLWAWEFSLSLVPHANAEFSSTPQPRSERSIP